jgi:L,D-transpeptidase catalytic domain
MRIDHFHMPQLLSRLRAGSLLSLALAVLSLAAGTVSASAGAPHVGATQRLAVLLSSHRVHRGPRAGSPLTGALSAQRPITGEPTTLPVLGRRIGPEGLAWLHVLLPGRPNGASGWIALQGTKASITIWHLTIDLRARLVRVYRYGRVVRSFRAVVGKGTTPTPVGRFFVEETLQMYAGELGGPFALALSARSNVLQEFEGGPGQIALHGRDGLGGTLGQAESHGCVRLDTASIDWLAARIGPGTPASIYAG